MQEKYFNFLKKSLLSPEEATYVFFILIKYYEIDELKKIPEFQQLKDIVIAQNISPQVVFEKVAIEIVQRGKFLAIKFLMDECGYDLTQAHDRDSVNLLHEACLFGTTELVKYLLQKGFSPNTPDFRGETPLHRAAVSKNNKALLGLLCQYDAKLNVKSQSGLTALHMSVIHNNPKATAELIKQGADPKLKWNNLTYIELKAAIARGEFEARSSISFSPKKNAAEIAFSAYFKSCLLPKFDNLIFQNVLKAFSKIEKLALTELQVLGRAMTVTTSFSPFNTKLLQDTLSSAIKNNKATCNDVIYAVLNVSDFFLDEKIPDIIQKFNSLVLFLLNQKGNLEKISEEKQCEIYYVIGFRYKAISFMQKAKKYFQLALEKSSAKEDFKPEIFFNLGCTQQFLMEYEEALKSYRSAFDLNRTNMVSFQKYISMLLQCSYYEEALAVCNQVKFGRFSEIFTAVIKQLCGDMTWKDLLEIAEKDSPDEETQILSFDLRVECYLRCDHYEEALKAAEASFILKEKRFKAGLSHTMMQSIFKILQILIQTGEYQAGLERLKEWEESYSFELNCSVLFLGVAAVLYIATQHVAEAERAIQKINKIGVDPRVLARIYFSLGMEILSSKSESKKELALYYVNLALKIHPNHLEGQFYKLMSLILIGDKIAANEMLKTIDPEVLLDISLAKRVLKKEGPVLGENIKSDVPVIEANIQPSELNPEEKDFGAEKQEELAVEDYDPVKIHQFFQAEKQRLLNESVETLSQTPKPKAKWKIGSVSFEEGKDGLVAIEHHSYPNCYAVIHPYLALDPSLRKKFQAALNKGIATRKDTDGVQTLNNAVVQIAIREENRLYTTHVYLNENGQCLIVFDKAGNHKDVKQLARQERPLEAIPCKNTKQLPQYIIRCDSILVAPPSSEETSRNAVPPSIIKM